MVLLVTPMSTFWLEPEPDKIFPAPAPAKNAPAPRLRLHTTGLTDTILRGKQSI